MNIEDMTIKQAREIAAIFGGQTTPRSHPCVGKKVLVILPGRYIYIGTLEQVDEHGVLRDAKNLRYWETRENGLGEFAQDGPKSGDNLDDCPPVWFRFGEDIAIMECRYE